MVDSSQTTLLRVAAFLVDALLIAIALIIPCALVSYGMAWIGGSNRVQIVWFVALGIFLTYMIMRDGYRGRSAGKQLLGLRIMTPKGEGCSYPRSILRNLPLAIPPWALLDGILVAFGRTRTGDRIARTSVQEE
jgi:uncharacterized RDD family membrane protein YckC